MVTYPRNARSLSASSFSTPAGTSGTSAYSSVGKYDVSVTDLSVGGRGAGCIRNEFHSTPWNNECARISSTPARPSLQVINLYDPIVSHPAPKNMLDSPSHEIERLSAQMYLFWEVQVVWPVDNLFVRVARILGTERWIADQAFEHDRTQRPPIALLAVPAHHEHLRRDIVRRPHSRVCLFGKSAFRINIYLERRHAPVAADSSSMSRSSLLASS